MAAHSNVSLHDLQADDVRFANTDGGTRWFDLGPVTFFLPYDNEAAQDLLAVLIGRAAEALRSYGLTRGQVATLLASTGLTPAPVAVNDGVRELIDPALV